MGLSFKEKVIKYDTYEFCEQYTDPQKNALPLENTQNALSKQRLSGRLDHIHVHAFCISAFFFFLPELVALFMRHEQSNYANEQCFLV